MTSTVVPAAAGQTQTILGMQHVNKFLPGIGPGLVTEVTAAPGLGAPPHRHAVDSEAFYILEGTLTVELDGQTRLLHPGDMCLLPAGSEHAFRNEGPGNVRFLAVVTPGADALAFFTEIDAAGHKGNLTPDAVMAIGSAHGLAFGTAA